MANKVTVNLKMYRLNELGDCFLLTFKKGTKTSTMLVDFGSFRNSKASATRLNQIADDILKQHKNRMIDVVIGSHQHNDHINGFFHAQNKFKNNIDRVWLSWLDDPKNQEATRLQKSQLELKQTMLSIKDGLSKLKTSGDVKDKDKIIDEMIEAYGDEKSVTPEMAMNILKDIGKKNPKYLTPGQIHELPQFTKDEIKIYVLGPPVSRMALRDLTPNEDESYDKHLMSNFLASKRLLGAIESRIANKNQDREEAEFPFNADYKIPISVANECLEHYKQLQHGIKVDLSEEMKILEDPIAFGKMIVNYKSKPNEVIDDIWLDQIDRLSLYMDSFTNNSSLAIAIELVETGKVLLFPADAQTGNWNSWFDVKYQKSKTTTEDLMRNTIIYKVGHHGSHNATLVRALELMEHKDLVALIPVHKNDSNIKKPTNPWKMPATNLLARLKEKTKNRVLRMDDVFEKDCNPRNSRAAKKSWSELNYTKLPDATNKLFIEMEFEG